MTWGRDSSGRFRDRVITDYVIEAQTDKEHGPRLLPAVTELHALPPNLA